MDLSEFKDSLALRVPRQPKLHRKILSQKNKSNQTQRSQEEARAPLSSHNNQTLGFLE